MKKDYARLNTKIYNVPLALRFKAKMKRDGITYRAWLAEAMKNYVGLKPAPARAAATRKIKGAK